MGTGIPHWCRVGARVVCVDDAIRPELEAAIRAATGVTPSGSLDGLTKGSIYTIESINTAAPVPEPCVFLLEVPRAIFTPDGAMVTRVWGFAISRFRPLVDEASDNEIETRIFREKHARHDTTTPERVEA